jgi:hypothetical protein
MEALLIETNGLSRASTAFAREQAEALKAEIARSGRATTAAIAQSGNRYPDSACKRKDVQDYCNRGSGHPDFVSALDDQQVSRGW